MGFMVSGLGLQLTFVGTTCFLRRVDASCGVGSMDPLNP